MRRANEAPQTVYEDREGPVSAKFLGKGLPRDPEAALGPLLPPGVELAWLEQIHSAEVLDAAVGCAGRGDALVTDEPDLALAVVTADCVPVLMAAGETVAAVHAGWRGVVSRIVPAALDRLDRVPEVAWIGPAIGVDVYEVSPEVADQVVAVSDGSVRVEIPGGRPRVDLVAAVRIQLEAAGVTDIRVVGACTFTDDRLWSYRQEGPRAGRNFSVIWRSPG
jgi:hypothetical protein